MKDNNDKTKISLEKHRSLTEFFIKGEGLLRLYETAATGISLVNSFLILSSLTLYQFGLYQLVLSFLAIVSSLNFKFFDGMVSVEMRHFFNEKKLSSAKKIFKEYAFIKIVFSLILAVAVFFSSGLAAQHYGSDIGLFVKIISALLIIEALISIETVFFQSIFSFSYFGIPAAREFVKLILLSGFFFFGNLGIADVLGIHVLGWAGSLLLVSFFFIKSYKDVLAGVISSKAAQLGRIFKKFGVWIFLRFGFSRVTQNITPWFVKIFVSTEAVAVYSFSINLVSLLQEIFPVNIFPWVFLARIHKKEQMGYLFNRSVKYIFWFGLLLFTAGFFVFPPIIHLILPKYDAAMHLFRAMLLVLPLYGFYKLLKGVLGVLREYKILALRVISETVVIIGSLIIFLPLVGVMGAAISYFVTYLARIIFFYPALVRFYPHMKVRFRNIFVFDKHDREFVLKFLSQLSGITKKSSSK